MNAPKIPLDQIHLAAIPLSDRGNRRLLRDILEQYKEELEAARNEFSPDILMDDYLLQVKGVQIVELRQLDVIDALPDDEYVNAMVEFKKGVVLAYHAKAVADGKTTDTVYGFCVEYFHEEFSTVGRAAAELEINPVEFEETEVEPSVFIVGFDGTVVENQGSIIGAESPFAVATLRALQANGHWIIIWHDRDDVNYRDMMTFLKMGEVVPNGTIMKLPAGDINVSEIIDQQGLPLAEGQVKLPVDYIIHNSSFQCSRIAITGNESNVSFYWGDLVTDLVNEGYLTEEDKNDISSRLAAMTE